MTDAKTQLQQALAQAKTPAASPADVTRKTARRRTGKRTLQFQGGPPAHRASVKRARDLEYRMARGAKIWDLHKVDALTFRQAADAIVNYDAPDGTKFKKISSFTAHKDFTEHARHLAERFFESAEHRLQGIAARQDRRRRTLLPQAFGTTCPKCGAAKPDKDALRLLQDEDAMEAKLFGLTRKDGTYTAEDVGLIWKLTLQGLLAIAQIKAAIADPAVNRQVQAALADVARRLPDVQVSKSDGTHP